jgi:hypothetical protein
MKPERRAYAVSRLRSSEALACWTRRTSRVASLGLRSNLAFRRHFELPRVSSKAPRRTSCSTLLICVSESRRLITRVQREKLQVAVSHGGSGMMRSELSDLVARIALDMEKTNPIAADWLAAISRAVEEADRIGFARGVVSGQNHMANVVNLVTRTAP